MTRRAFLSALAAVALASIAAPDDADAWPLSRRELARLERRHRRLCRAKPDHDDCAVFRKP